MIPFEPFVIPLLTIFHVISRTFSMAADGFMTCSGTLVDEGFDGFMTGSGIPFDARG